MSFRNFLCKIGWHDWEPYKRYEYESFTDEGTYELYNYVCLNCSKTKNNIDSTLERDREECKYREYRKQLAKELTKDKKI